MSKAVRIYFGRKRYCYPDKAGINLLKVMRLYKMFPLATGTEEGAMVAHFASRYEDHT